MGDHYEKGIFSWFYGMWEKRSGTKAELFIEAAVLRHGQGNRTQGRHDDP